MKRPRIYYCPNGCGKAVVRKGELCPECRKARELQKAGAK